MKSKVEKNYTRARFTGILFRWIVTREDGEKVYCETREEARAIARQWREDA